MQCIGCEDEVPAERAELGYRHCVKQVCRERYGEGLTVTVIAVNKSAPVILVGDAAEIARRGSTGEFALKGAGLGVGYRSPQPQEAPRARGPVARPTPARRPWTEQQETVVRLYAGLGLAPRQIAERARTNTPRLGITERLATQILCTLPRRRPRI